MKSVRNVGLALGTVIGVLLVCAMVFANQGSVRDIDRSQLGGNEVKVTMAPTTFTDAENTKSPSFDGNESSDQTENGNNGTTTGNSDVSGDQDLEDKDDGEKDRNGTTSGDDQDEIAQEVEEEDNDGGDAEILPNVTFLEFPLFELNNETSDLSSEEADQVMMMYPPVYGIVDGARPERMYMKKVDGTYQFLVLAREGFEIVALVILINADGDDRTGLQDSKPSGIDYAIDLNLDWSAQTDTVTIVMECGISPGTIVNPACAMNRTWGETMFNVSSDLVGLIEVEENGEMYTRGVEFAIPEEMFSIEGGKPLGDNFKFAFEIGVKSELGPNNVTSSYYSEPQYLSGWFDTYQTNNLPSKCAADDGSLRAAVVYSELNRDLLYGESKFALNYAQLYMVMQYQLTQAGLPYDLIDESDLMDISKVCRYKVLVLPDSSHCAVERAPDLIRSLFLLRHFYGVGIVAGSTICAQDEKDELVDGTYRGTEEVLGITYDGYAQVSSAKLYVNKDTSVPPIYEEILNEEIGDIGNTGAFLQMFKAFVPASGTTMVTSSLIMQEFVSIAGVEPVNSTNVYPAVLAVDQKEGEKNGWGKQSGRVCHFASLKILANQDIAWQCMQWIVQQTTPTPFSLLASRFDHVFTTRVDCDKSMNMKDQHVFPAYTKQFMEPMKKKHNFVASYFINIGANKTNFQWTDWPNVKPRYDYWMELGNEIGSHSYTHPFAMNSLSEEEFLFEFKEAKEVIAEKLGLDQVSTAQPGESNNFESLNRMSKIQTTGYFSGGYSGLLPLDKAQAGFPGAFGFPDPESTMIYVAPNYIFDYTMIGFGTLTPQEALEVWLLQLDMNTRLANVGIGHWPIHDYGPVNFGYKNQTGGRGEVGFGNGYDMKMFTDTIKAAAELGHEFITTFELSERIRAIQAAQIIVEPIPKKRDSYMVTALPSLPEHSFGSLALSLMGIQKNKKNKNVDIISSVAVINGKKTNGWYAFSDTKIFLPENGSKMTVSLSTSSNAKVTRITKLPMRARLIDVSGDGDSLSCDFYGQGEVEVVLSSAVKPKKVTVKSNSKMTVKRQDRLLIITFKEGGTHRFRVAA